MGFNSSAFSIEGDSLKRVRDFRCEDLVIPEGIKNVRRDALFFCENLKKITIPVSLTNFSSGAFSGCRTLKEVHIKSLKKWSESFFKHAICNPLYYAHNLYLNGELVEELVIPKGVTHISSYAFANCTCLKSVTFPASLKSIGEEAFKGCTNLEKVIFNGTELAIKRSVFAGCTSLPPQIISNGVVLLGFSQKHAIIPDGVTTISPKAFDFCDLESITIPSSVTTIGAGAFSYVRSLKEVHISDIEAWCRIDFSDTLSNPLCYAHNLYLNGKLVEELVVSKELVNVSKGAFEDCRCIKKIYIEDISGWLNGVYTFLNDMPSHEIYVNGELVENFIIPDGITSIHASTFKNCCSLKSIILSDSVTTIESRAFCGCSALENIHIPDSVTTIGECAFEKCPALVAVHITDLAAWCKIQFEKSRSEFGSNPLFSEGNLYLKGELVEELVIPDNVNAISHGAFIHCSSITKVVIPDSVTEIGEEAFSGCKALSQVVIPDSITDIDRIFYGCPILFHYYEWEQDQFVLRTTFGAPDRVKELYARARMNYTITYHCEDCASDTGDNGMGYDYDNSYTIHREPKMSEMVIKDGNLYGFAVRGKSNILSISSAQTITQNTYQSPRYQSGSSWNLTYDPGIARYLWIPNVNASSEDYRFNADSFPGGLVKNVVKQIAQEDNYGHFDGRFDVTVELTDAAADDPDGTIAEISKYYSGCVLLKKP